MFLVYSKENCNNCRVAIQILRNIGADVSVAKLGIDYDREDLMQLAPKAKQLPQVFYEGELIGDLSELRDWLNQRP